ncbi:hypothetical protein EI427_12120 [Flammeovirga pectinis]|uniref:Uncharacterized protein n=1 Tax=Flammeovirga pectinis TaxID=2494373 RepID=A0A3Q9FQL0_9BACT|nr:hypothetical protein [Flammeovirga pectinis]AZQ62957.1 hypothetical protein EI427_12120 [Flammeovirga pectinis]
MYTILSLLIVLNIYSDNNGIGKIAKANARKSTAESAFKAEDYKTAIEEYTYLLDSMSIQDDAAMLDLGHAYFLSEDAENATKRYASIQNSANKKIASIANQQLGVIKAQAKEIKPALAFLKAAMKHDPKNLAARYDYEMLLKQKNEQDQQDQENKDDNKDQKDQDKDKQDKDQEKDQNKEDQEKEDQDQEQQDKQDQQDQQDQQNKDQKGEDQQDQEQQDQEQQDQQKGEQGEETEEEREQREQEQEQQQFNERMEEIKMPASQAQMILDALKNNEVQYFQQKKKKSNKNDRNKPDW